MSNQHDIVPATVESDFYIGDEDIDDSPVRYLEIVGFQQSKLRCGVKYFPNRLTAASHATLLKVISVKINHQKTFSAHKPNVSGDAIVLYRVFRI